MIEIEQAIAKLTFVDAKHKKPEHQYTVKSDELLAEYWTLYNYIKDHYYIKFFRHYPYKYCDIGDYTYWYMSDDFGTSRVINRVPRIQDGDD